MSIPLNVTVEAAPCDLLWNVTLQAPGPATLVHVVTLIPEAKSSTYTLRIVCVDADVSFVSDGIAQADVWVRIVQGSREVHAALLDQMLFDTVLVDGHMPLRVEFYLLRATRGTLRGRIQFEARRNFSHVIAARAAPPPTSERTNWAR